MERSTVILILFLTFCTSSAGQVYPDSNASWCIHRDINGPPGQIFVMYMPPDHDTLINGVTYQKVYDQSHIFGLSGFPWEVHYVRSSNDGMGYTYLPDSAAEFVTMDLNASVGDTVQNVFVINEVWTCQTLFPFIVVDSIVAIDVQGVPRDRFYLSSDCFPGSEGFDPRYFFWQEGLGTSHGPVLAMTNGLSPAVMVCAEVNDTNVYSASANPCGCTAYTSISEFEERPDISIIPGNIMGQFIIDHTMSLDIEVFNSAGALVLQTNGLGFDISHQPPGIYIVRLRGKAFVWSQKVVR